MNNENLKLAENTMSQFIGTYNEIEYTKNVLVYSHGFDDEEAQELADSAWKEYTC